MLDVCVWRWTKMSNLVLRTTTWWSSSCPLLSLDLKNHQRMHHVQGERRRQRKRPTWFFGQQLGLKKIIRECFTSKVNTKNNVVRQLGSPSSSKNHVGRLRWRQRRSPTWFTFDVQVGERRESVNKQAHTWIEKNVDRLRIANLSKVELSRNGVEEPSWTFSFTFDDDVEGERKCPTWFFGQQLGEHQVGSRSLRGRCKLAEGRTFPYFLWT